MVKVILKKDLLHPIDGEDRMCGKESVIDMDDLGRMKYLLGHGHVDIVPQDMPLTIFPPTPKPIRTKQANEIGEVIAEALKKGLTFTPPSEADLQPKDKRAA